MSYFKVIILGGVLALLASVAPSFFGLHATVAHAADCTINTADLAQIATIQNDPTLSYSDEIKAELAVRQKLVAETIACAEQDVQAFQTALKAVPTDPSFQSLQSQLSGQLDYTTNFYTTELAKSNQNGIAETKIIAKEVFDYRKNSFLPLTDQINNFILWSQNQALFGTAQTRMDQTSRAVAFLESASPNTDLQSAFTAALASFNGAQSQNAAAKSALTQSLPADQSLALIKQSLDSLSATYQGFAKVSSVIKGILPQ